MEAEAVAAAAAPVAEVPAPVAEPEPLPDDAPLDFSMLGLDAELGVDARPDAALAAVHKNLGMTYVPPVPPAASRPTRHSSTG